MIKKIIVILLVLAMGIFTLDVVKANCFDVDYIYKLDPVEEDLDCDGLFGNPNEEGTVAHFMNDIFEIMKWVAPLLCLAFSVVEFVKAAASQDKEALNKAFSKTIKRIVLALVMFFLPKLINVIFPLIGFYGTCGVG